MGIARSFIPVKPTERVLVLGEITFELRRLWVRQCQVLRSIVSFPSDAAFIDELPAQNAELILKQVFHPREKKKKVFFKLPFFPCLVHILCSSRERMLLLKDI